MTLFDRIASLRERSWLAEMLAGLGGVTYIVQAFIYAHTQFSVLDEGAYLVKGYLFATGQYTPFQDFGPWTNHMPLSFLIPGWVQAIIEPGLRTGRYFSIFLGVVLLLGLWWVVRRLGGRWWAAVAVWVIALNPALIKMYSQAVSQVLAAAMLVWVLALVLGVERKTYQLWAGAALAGVLTLTRLNLAPVLLFLILYVWWQYGWRRALQAGLAGGIVVLIGHAVYWPNILRMWAFWAPDGFPLFESWAIPVGADPSWTSAISPQGRFNAFWWAIRYNFVPVTSVLTVWLLWPRRQRWGDQNRFCMAVFLSVVFAFLFLIHFYATIAGSHCVYCLSVYLAFFDVVGLILLVVAWPELSLEVSRSRWVLISVFILLFIAFIGYAAFDVIGDNIVTPRMVRRILFFEVPRFDGLQVQEGSIAVWGLLENRFGLDYNQLFPLLRDGLKYAVSALAGLLVGILVILTPRYFPEITDSLKFNRAVLALMALLVVGLLLSPTPVLGAGYRDYDCGGDVLASYETVGASLAEYIPEGASVYWDGGKSAVPLLYLPGRQIYPAQLNGAYSFRLGGEADALLGYGFWSADLQQSWQAEADYLLIEERVIDNYVLDTDAWTEIAETPPAVVCFNDATIHIFQRSP